MAFKRFNKFKYRHKKTWDAPTSERLPVRRFPTTLIRDMTVGEIIGRVRDITKRLNHSITNEEDLFVPETTEKHVAFIYNDAPFTDNGRTESDELAHIQPLGRLVVQSLKFGISVLEFSKEVEHNPSVNAYVTALELVQPSWMADVEDGFYERPIIDSVAAQNVLFVYRDLLKGK